MFYVYSSSNIAIISNFMVGKSILQEMATLVISRETSDSNLETGRCSPKSGPRLPDYPGELTALFSVGNLWFTRHSFHRNIEMFVHLHVF